MFVSDACLNKDTLVPLMHATADLIKANEREHLIHAKVVLYSVFLLIAIAARPYACRLLRSLCLALQ